MPLPRISNQPVFLADRAPSRSAEEAADEHFGGGLGIWKEARTKHDGRLRIEQLPQEAHERALEISHAHMLTDHEALDLVEHRQVRQIRIVATIDGSWRDDPDRGLMRFHVTDLHA